jgi:DNA adenine methylase Dam
MFKSPINYTGSKFVLLDRLLPLFPKDVDVFVDLFAGGGSVYMNVSGMYPKVIANDSLDILIQIHQRLMDSEFIRKASIMSIATIDSQENYIALRDSYNRKPTPEKLLALIWSCNSGFMRFNKSGQFNQTWGKRGFNKAKAEILNIYQANYQHDHVEFCSGSYLDVQIPDNSFVYIDPPYSNTEAGYNATWTIRDDQTLLTYIENLLHTNVRFGLSGVSNGKPNLLFEALSNNPKVKTHFFGDVYEKVTKVSKTNNEYYLTNC